MAGRSERGESLLELLVALSIMSVAVIAVIGAIATSVRLSDVHRRQTVARSYLTDFAETVEASVAASPTSGYKACAATNGSDYDGLYSAPSPYEDKVVSVEYWNATAKTWGTSGCTTSNDSGIQRLSLRVRVTSGNTVSEGIQIIIRRPCRSGDTPACA